MTEEQAERMLDLLDSIDSRLSSIESSLSNIDSNTPSTIHDIDKVVSELRDININLNN